MRHRAMWPVTRGMPFLAFCNQVRFGFKPVVEVATWQPATADVQVVGVLADLVFGGVIVEGGILRVHRCMP